MAFRIEATNFQKRINSTALPRSFDASFDVVLKEQTSWNNPTFILSTNDFNYNYIKWSSWYYHVKDVTYIHNGLIEVSCEVDNLATFRDEIFESTQFVAYANVPNTEISDTRLSLKTSATSAENVSEKGFDYLGAGYCVALNVIAKTKTASYLLSIEDAANILNSIQTWNEGLLPPMSSYGTFDLSDVPKMLACIGDAITVGLRQLTSSGHVAECIKSAYLIPMPLTAKDGVIPGGGGIVIEEIYLGEFNTRVQGRRIVRRGMQDGCGVAIPWQANDWRRNAPYHEVYLYVPFIGNIAIPTSAVIDTQYLYINVAFDEVTGEAVFTISKGSIEAGSETKVLFRYGANLCTNFPIGSSNVTPIRAATSAIGLAGGAVAAVATGPVGVAAGTAAITGGLNGVTALPSTIGSASGGAILSLFGTRPRCMSIYHAPTVEPSSVRHIIGEPLMAVRQLSDFSGYVECRNAHIGIHGHIDSAKAIESALNNGVYLE